MLSVARSVIGVILDGDGYVQDRTEERLGKRRSPAATQRKITRLGLEDRSPMEGIGKDIGARLNSRVALKKARTAGQLVSQSLLLRGSVSSRNLLLTLPQ